MAASRTLPPQRTATNPMVDDDYLRFRRVNKQLPSGPPLSAEQERHAGQQYQKGVQEMERVIGRDGKKPSIRALLRRR